MAQHYPTAFSRVAHGAWKRHCDDMERGEESYACSVVRGVAFAGGSQSEEEWDSVAALAFKHPSLIAAVERRGIPARRQNLATVARYQTLALPLTCVARIVPAIAGGIVAGFLAATGIVAGFIAAIISVIGFSVSIMAPFPPGGLPAIQCNEWNEFLAAVQKYFGHDCPCPPNSAIALLLNDTERNAHLAWCIMSGLYRAARNDVEMCALGIPRTTPRKTIISLLKRYAMNFHPDKTSSRTDISEEKKE